MALFWVCSVLILFLSLDLEPCTVWSVVGLLLIGSVVFVLCVFFRYLGLPIPDGMEAQVTEDRGLRSVSCPDQKKLTATVQTSMFPFTVPQGKVELVVQAFLKKWGISVYFAEVAGQSHHGCLALQCSGCLARQDMDLRQSSVYFRLNDYAVRLLRRVLIHPDRDELTFSLQTYHDCVEEAALQRRHYEKNGYVHDIGPPMFCSVEYAADPTWSDPPSDLPTWMKKRYEHCPRNWAFCPRSPPMLTWRTGPHSGTESVGDLTEELLLLEEAQDDVDEQLESGGDSDVESGVESEWDLMHVSEFEGAADCGSDAAPDFDSAEGDDVVYDGTKGEVDAESDDSD